MRRGRASGMRAALPRVALAQRAAWSRLRSSLRLDLLDSGISTDGMQRALKAFDGVPFHSARLGPTWLPSATELDVQLRATLEDVGGVDALSRLTRAAHSAQHALRTEAARAADGSIGERIDVLDGGSREGHLHSVVWHGPRPAEAERTAFTVSAQRLRWLRRAHALVRAVAADRPPRDGHSGMPRTAASRHSRAPG